MDFIKFINPLTGKSEKGRFVENMGMFVKVLSIRSDKTYLIYKTDILK